MFKKVVVSIAVVASSVDAACCPDTFIVEPVDPKYQEILDNMCNNIAWDDIKNFVPKYPDILGGSRVIPQAVMQSCAPWKNEVFLGGWWHVAEETCSSAPNDWPEDQEIEIPAVILDNFEGPKDYCWNWFQGQLKEVAEGSCAVIEEKLREDGILTDGDNFPTCSWVTAP